jgi:DNA-binding CsgD family transcriptional regulator
VALHRNAKSAAQPRDIDDRVVQGLYDAAAGRVPWKHAFAAMDAAIGNVIGSQMVTVDRTTGQLLRSEQPDNTPIAAVMEYIREYHRIDPHVPYVAAKSIGDVIHTEDAFPATVYRNHPFYQQFWIPNNVRSFVGAKVAEDDRHQTVIGVLRSLDAPAYTEPEIRLASRYFSHLIASFRIARYLQQLRSTAHVGHELMEASDHPMVLVDAGCRVLATNAAAHRMLAKNDLLSIRDEFLHGSTAETENRLKRAIAMLHAAPPGTHSSAKSKRTAVRLRSTNGTTAFCSLWDMRPELTMAAFGPQPVALLTITQPNHAATVDPVLLGSMFDFTPAESRLAVAMMTGAALDHVSAQSGVSISTVRSHLRSMFIKTETHRQAQLVKLLVESTSG